MKNLIDGVKVKRLVVHADERGRLMEILRSDDEVFQQFGQVYITTAYPGTIKAWHYHKKQTDNFVCVQGMMKVVLFDPRVDEDQCAVDLPVVPAGGGDELGAAGDAADALFLVRPAALLAGAVGVEMAHLVVRLIAEVGMPEFEEAVERVVAGLEKKNRLINPEERKVVAHHEMGHALVALSLPGTDPVQKISIIPRGIAALGYTMQVPTEDRFLMKKSELLNRIASLLGGRAAEEIIFADISTGAQNDLSRATDIAKSMIKEYGMSDRLGQVYLAHDKREQFLDMGMPEKADYSNTTAEAIDEEISAIITREYARALEILRAKKSNRVTSGRDPESG